MAGVIAENRKGFKPGDAGRLAEELRRRLGGVPVSVRVATSHVEVSATVSTEELVRAVEGLVGRVVGEIGGYEGLSSYMALIREERYWEAHEALEAVWSRNKDPGLQALILAAAAMAKAQEGRREGALKIVSRLERLQGEVGLDVVDTGCLRMEVERVYRGERGFLEKCLRMW